MMNDYTKNISGSIFTPGVHYIPQKSPVMLKKHFAKTREGTGKLDNAAEQPIIKEDAIEKEQEINSNTIQLDFETEIADENKDKTENDK